MILENDLGRCATVAGICVAGAVFAAGLAENDAHATQTKQQDPHRPESKTALSGLAEVDWGQWTDLEDLLSRVRQQTGIPAIAAACVGNGKTLDSAVIGVREFGKKEPVKQDDPFHLGSVTKSITATVIGKLVEDGVLSWNTRIGDAVGDVEIRKEYRSVTIENLLQHRGGLPAYTDGLPQVVKQPGEQPGTPTESRATFVAHILGQEPAGLPGETFLYSNAGYTLVGYIAERASGLSWEQLVEKHVYKPIGMKNCGFGFPEQPRGHQGKGPTFTVTPAEKYPSMDVVAPAGNAHCSVADLAQYTMFHLNGLNGSAGYLRAETVTRLHTPPADGSSPYAAGWFVRRAADGEEIHSHGGTVGSSYAELKLFPASNIGVMLLMNVGPDIGEPVANKIGQAMLARFRPEAPAMKTPVATITQKRARDSETGRAVTVLEGLPEDEARSWAVMKQLCLALNDEDFDAFSDLFAQRNGAAALEPQQNFDFMTKNVFPHRGGIRSFHAVSPPIEVESSAPPVRFVVFHLENGYPGYIGISLNEEDKIDHFSLFVKSDLCPNGADPQCKEIVNRLNEDESP